MLDKNVSTISKLLIYAVLCFFAIILIAPFMYMISMALATPESNIKDTYTLIPREFYFANFKTLFSNFFEGSAPIGWWLINSIMYAGLAIVGQIFSSSMVAYGFSRMRYKHKNKIFMVVLATMMLPGQITLIPVFLIFKNLGLYNTLWPLIIPQFMGSAFNIFFTRQFMAAIPGSLYEAAEMDGLGYFKVYQKIVLPLVKPALYAIAIFTFNGAWGDFMGPLIYTSNPTKATMALGAQLLSASSNPNNSINLSILMCMSMVLTLPQLWIFIFGQKYLFTLNLGIGNSGTK